MPRTKRTGIQLEAVRAKILDAAYSILQEEGPAEISTRAIGNRLGVAHMALYRYFPNQAAILRALRDRELARWRARQQAFETRARTEDVVQVVREMLQSVAAFANENPNVYRLAWVIPEVMAETAEATRERIQGTVRQAASVLKIAMDRKAVPKRDPFVAAATALAIVNTPHILFYSGKLTDPALRDRMAQEVLSAAMLWLLSGVR